MTKPKRKRLQNGQFVKKEAVIKRDTPGTHGQMPHNYTRPDAPPTPKKGHPPAICEECGAEYEYRKIRRGRQVMDLGSCPVCNPDPITALLE